MYKYITKQLQHLIHFHTKKAKFETIYIIGITLSLKLLEAKKFQTVF